MSQWYDQLSSLAILDSKRRIFGAHSISCDGGHKYKPQPVSESELANFESWCGAQLPNDYRYYLLNIGFGPGPYYGLMSFKEINTELEIIYEAYEEELGAIGRPGTPFEFEEEINKLIAYDPEGQNDFVGPQTPGGFMPICEEGCDYLTVMITNGKFAGRVFHVTNFGLPGCKWRAADRPPGIVEYQRPSIRLPGFPAWPDFSQWVNGWLEQCVSDLQSDHVQ